jgi:hypothetical protein
MAMDFVADNSAFYNTAEFADPSIYQPVTGDPVAVNIIIENDLDDEPEEFESKVGERLITISAPYSAIGTPGRGDTFTVGSDVYTVDGIKTNNRIDVVAFVRQTT